jgi:hypothetical protein
VGGFEVAFVVIDYLNRLPGIVVLRYRVEINRVYQSNRRSFTVIVHISS